MLVAISLNTGQRITLQIFPTSCDMIVQLYALFRMISFRLFYAKCNEQYLSPSQQRETPFRTPQVQSCPPLCDWTVFDVMRMREYMQARAKKKVFHLAKMYFAVIQYIFCDVFRF